MRSTLAILAVGIGVVMAGCGSSSKTSPTPSSGARNLNDFCAQARSFRDTGARESQLLTPSSPAASSQSQQLIALVRSADQYAAAMAKSAPGDIQADASYLAGVVGGLRNGVDQTKGDPAALLANLTILVQDPVYTMSLQRINRYLTTNCGFALLPGS